MSLIKTAVNFLGRSGNRTNELKMQLDFIMGKLLTFRQDILDFTGEFRLLSKWLFLPKQDNMSVNYLSFSPVSHLIATCSLPIWWLQSPPRTDLQASFQLTNSPSQTKDYYPWKLESTTPNHINWRKSKNKNLFLLFPLRGQIPKYAFIVQRALSFSLSFFPLMLWPIRAKSLLYKSPFL